MNVHARSSVPRPLRRYDRSGTHGGRVKMSPMPEKTFIVRFMPPETSVQPVTAATAEIVEGYLVLLHDDGTLSAFFAADCVESWALEAGSS